MSDAEDPTQLPSDDVDLIRPLLDEFKSAKRSARKNVVRKAVTTIMAAKDVTHLRPLAQGKLIAKVKEVFMEWLAHGYFTRLTFLTASKSLALQSWTSS
jgi:hypothetical protein